MAVHSAERGGAQLVALGQARALRREYDLVIAVGTGPLRPRSPRSLPPSSAVRLTCRTGARRAAGGRSRSAVPIPDAVRFAGLVRRHRIDVVVVNSTVLVAPVIGARLAGVPVIVHAQEAPKSAAAKRLFRVHGVLAHTVVAISPWIAQAFAVHAPASCSNPVGIPIPRDPGPRELCAADPLRLVMVGTVDRHKRQAVAIAAVRALRDIGLEAELTLHGLEADPAYAAQLREQARDLNVGAAGPLRGADLRRRRPPAGRGRTATPGGRGDSARSHGGDGAQDARRRGAYRKHPRRRHRRGERAARRPGRPGRARRGGRSASATRAAWRRRSPKRDAAAWRRNSTSGGGTAG